MFVRPEVEVIKFEAIDVIATSPVEPGPADNAIVLPDDE